MHGHVNLAITRHVSGPSPQAEEAEVSCVESSGNSFDAQECTANFLEAADGIEQVRLAALASGTGSPEDRVVARAAVKRARQRRVSSVLEAEQDELDCVQVAFRPSDPSNPEP